MRFGRPAGDDRDERALVVVMSAGRILGGAERSMLSFAARLPERGFDVLLTCPEGALARRAREVGVRVETRSWWTVSGISGTADGVKTFSAARTLLSLVQTAMNAVRLAVLARRHRADLLLSNSLPSHLVVAAAGVMSRVPTAWYLRDIVDAGRGRRVLAWGARPVGVLLSISRAVSATYQHDRIVEVPQPVASPPSSAERPDTAGDEVVVGYLGRLDPRKGVEDVCEVAGRLSTAFLIAGEGLLASAEHVKGLHDLAEARAPGRVTFLGAVPDPWTLLDRVDVLLVPSRREPWGRVAAEAQLMGRPVVAARAGGLPEIVDDGVDGLLYEPGNIDELERCLRRLVDDPALRRRFGQAGRSKAAHYDPEVNAAHVAAALRLLVPAKSERTST